VNDEETVVKGLEMGADDYIVKPFRPRELRARVAAVLRRSRELSEKPKRALTPLVCGDLKLDPRSRQVTVSERAVRLTPHEFGVLEYLMLNEGMVVRIHDILSNIWGFDADQDEHAVRVTIARLRQKIEPDPSHPRYVLNLPGEGYMVKTPG
jgi:DNA-binding response OmpR family regulator